MVLSLPATATGHSLAWVRAGLGSYPFPPGSQDSAGHAQGWHNPVPVADDLGFVAGEAPALDIDVEAISGRRQLDVVRIKDTHSSARSTPVGRAFTSGTAAIAYVQQLNAGLPPEKHRGELWIEPIPGEPKPIALEVRPCIAIGFLGGPLSDRGSPWRPAAEQSLAGTPPSCCLPLVAHAAFH